MKKKRDIRKFKEKKDSLKFFCEFEVFQKSLINDRLELFKSNSIANDQTEYEDKHF